MKYQINLFPPKEQGITDKIIYFSFNYLRYILVLTQLVVICVFFYRFKIDQEVVDLKDSIKQKGEIITVSSTLLREMQYIDSKMKNISQIISDQSALQKMYSYFLSSFPSQMRLTKLTIDGRTIVFEGFTTDIAIVKIYYSRLIKDKQFKDVKLESLSRNESAYTFSFSLVEFLDKPT